MKNVVIGVGGTGTKVVEALVYLSVFGAPDMAKKIGDKIAKGSTNRGFSLKKKTEEKPDDLRDFTDNFVVRIVDPDGTNETLGRLNRLLDCFRVEGDGIDLNNLIKGFSIYSKKDKTALSFRSTMLNVSTATNVRWDNPHEGTIEETFSGTDQKNLRSLFYSKYDREVVQLDDGCWGKPRIGTLALTYGFNKDYDEIKSFWPNLVNQADFNDGVKLMFAGSVFGGTGASVIRNLSRAYANRLEVADKCGIGMLFVLPYYQYADKELCGNGAESKYFSMNTKLALSYYKDSLFDGLKNVYPVAYLAGGNPDSPMYMDTKEQLAKVSKSGKDQDNPAMPTDLFAALSLMHFFSTPTKEKGHAESVYSPTASEKSIPYPSIANIVINRLDLFCELWGEAHDRLLNGNIGSAPFTHLGLEEDKAREDWSRYLSKVNLFTLGALKWLEQLKGNGLDDYDDIMFAQKDLSKALTKWSDNMYKYRDKNDDWEALYRRLFFTCMKTCEEFIKEA
jgi:hypothetical protein